VIFGQKTAKNKYEPGNGGGKEADIQEKESLELICVDGMEGYFSATSRFELILGVVSRPYHSEHFGELSDRIQLTG
jgi:hypothetical protein